MSLEKFQNRLIMALFDLIPWICFIISFISIVLFLVIATAQTFSINLVLPGNISSSDSGIIALISALLGAVVLANKTLFSRVSIYGDKLTESADAIKKDIDDTLLYLGVHGRSNSYFNYITQLPDSKNFADNDVLQFNGGLRHYAVLHTEALYYSVICSILERYSGQIMHVSRSHIFLSGSQSSSFITEIVGLCEDFASVDAYYLFRSEVLDYDRDAIRQGERTYMWPVYAQASRILLRDPKAYYGYLSLGTKFLPIWNSNDGGVDQELLPEHCERIEILLADEKYVSATVLRQKTTFEFISARITFTNQRDPGFYSFFNKLKSVREGNSKHLNKAAFDAEHVSEMGLVSGEEMEALAGRGCVMWALDDFPFQSNNSAGDIVWLDANTTRGIAWRKTIAVVFKGTVVQRLFLVDAERFKPGDANINFIVNLFSSVAVQYLFFTELELPMSSTPYGEIRLLFKDSKAHKIHANDKLFPDLTIMTRKEDTILGGVVVQPNADYIPKENLGDQGHNILDHVKQLWRAAEGEGEFPRFFAPVASILRAKKEDIVKYLERRDEIRSLQRFRVNASQNLLVWVEEILDQISQNKSN